MLTRKEEKLIRKYELLSRLGFPTMLLAFVTPFVWLVLCTIENLGFHAPKTNITGMYIMFGVVIFYIVVFAYSVLCVQCGMRSRKWRTIMDKSMAQYIQGNHTAEIGVTLGTRAVGNLMSQSSNKAVQNLGKGAQIASTMITVDVVDNITEEQQNNVDSVLKANNMKPHKCSLLKTVIMWVPLVILLVAYIPIFASANEYSKEQIRVCSETLDKLEKSLSEVCEYVSADDPKEYFDTDGYSVTGYIRDSGEKYNSQITVEIDGEGIVKEVSYWFHVDDSKSKTDNIEYVTADMLTLYMGLKTANPEVASDVFINTDKIPSALEDAYTSLPSEEKIHENQDVKDNIKLTYGYVPIEEYNDTAYLYFILETEK